MLSKFTKWACENIPGFKYGMITGFKESFEKRTKTKVSYEQCENYLRRNGYVK